MAIDMKIVADSSSDVLELNKISFASAPLKIVTANREYVDDASLDVEGMANDMQKIRERSSTACPSVQDYLDAFGDAKHVFCVTITSSLSGSYNSARLAKEEYENAFPDRKVFVIDSLSTGPEMKLIIDKIEENIVGGKSFDEICERVAVYMKHTGLLFMLESMKNLANNGRVSRIVASAAGILDIRLIGKASDKGELEMLAKVRGAQRSIIALKDNLIKLGYNGGRLLISHCCNEEIAVKLKEAILNEFKKAKIEIYRARGLCSFYAEKGGVLVGFEKAGVSI